jgi:transcriptional regulator with XRE-family HTH domain
MELKEAFGKALRQKRQEVGLSQEALADRAGLSRNYVNEVENGRYNVTLQTIAKFASALECRIKDLVKGID